MEIPTINDRFYVFTHHEMQQLTLFIESRALLQAKKLLNSIIKREEETHKEEDKKNGI